MTKKLIGLLAVALFGITTINAATQSALGTTGTNSVTGTPTNQTPTLPNGGAAVFTCSFSIPAGDTLTSVTLTINDPFSLATSGTTNELEFSYAISGFAGATALTDTIQGGPSDIGPGQDMGVDPDEGGLVPAATPAECAFFSNVALTCTTTAFVGTGPSFSFTVSGSAAWLAGSLQNGGAEQFSVFYADTYTAPPPPVPEPGTLLMMGGGLIGLVLAGRRKFRA